MQGPGAGLEGGVDLAVFGAVEGVAGVVGPGWGDHAADEALAYYRRAEHYADEFVDLRYYLWVCSGLVVVEVRLEWDGGDGAYFRVETDHLIVPATMPALAHHALADTVQTRQFQAVEFPVLVLLAAL